MATQTLKDLTTKYGVPVNVKKPRWYGDYFFRAEKINRNGTVSGTIIKGGAEHEKKSFAQSEIMELIDPSSKKKRSSKVVDGSNNPNHLDTDKSHYIPGVTTLFVKKNDDVRLAVFERFGIKDGREVIYVIAQGNSKATFYSFPQSRYVFPNKDDAQSYIDKEYRKFGLSPSHSIINAFETKPRARKPVEDTQEEIQYEKNYHEQVDAKLQLDLAVPQKKKDDALYDKLYADANLREAIVAARENGCVVDDHTYISYQIKKETADERISSAQEQISKIEVVRQKPYFARIDCGRTMRDLHTVYLGDEDIDEYVVSWRHPEYGNAYYQSNIIQGRGDIVLALKRIVSILNGKFDHYEDDINVYAVADLNRDGDGISLDNATDELLTRLLQESRTDKTTHDIIKTIQGEQYEIITSDFAQNAVINGCAGSGKTMIMYHRLSYMAYNYETYLGRAFDPKSVYIISPSGFFDTSNNELLRKLSISKVNQAPFYKQVDFLLDQYCAKQGIIPFQGIVDYVDTIGTIPENFFSSLEFDNFDIKCKSVDTTSFEFKQWVMSIANYILKSQGFKPIVDFMPKSAKEIQACLATSDYYYHDCFSKKTSGRFYSKLAITGISIENVLSALERASERTSPQYLQRKKRINKTIGLLRCCLSLTTKTDIESKIVTDIPDFWTLVSSPTIYEKMLAVVAAEKMMECLLPEKTNTADYILKCLWVYKNLYTSDFSEYIKLYFLQSLSGQFGAVVKEPALIFIDEFQNYSPYEIRCIKDAYESPTFNLFGDYDQRIEDKGYDLKSNLTSMLSPNSYNINVNYRNAKQITEYINRNVHKNMQSIGVQGTAVETSLDECNFKISDRTAIICKDPKLALIFLKRYIDADLINNSSVSKELVPDKYTLMTVLDCKGLEFDTVYVLDYGMNDNEKYVAYTRALDTLVVISDDLELLKKAEVEAERKRREEERLREKQGAEPDNGQGHDNNSADELKQDDEKRGDEGILLEQTLRFQEELRKLEEYRVTLERKEEKSRSTELERTERLYLLALSKGDSNDIVQLNEAIVLLETILDYKNAVELVAKFKVKISQITAKREEDKAYYRRMNLCQYCGGKFKGLFRRQCRNCGKKKDY